MLRRRGALSKISQEDVIRYVERHAQDWSPGTGKAMCWSLRAFLRYLHHRGLNSRPLADCVPSMRRWKLATLPTYLPAAQVRKALDGCDRETVMGRRDYAILLLLAKLGLRADEVATLTLDDIDWRASEILVRAKGRQRARMPISPDIGAAIVAYLRNGRPKSSCRLPRGNQGDSAYCLTYRCSRARSVASFILLLAWVEEEAGCGDGRGFGAPGLLRWQPLHHCVVVTSDLGGIFSVGANSSAFACSLRQDLSRR